MYKSARGLSEADGYYLNINFELLNGCKFKCPGCHVEKEGQAPVTEDDYKNLKTLLQSFEGGGYIPWIVFVGPTDFLVADNFQSVFSDPKVLEIFGYFKRISLQTTYLDIRNATKIAEVLNTHFSNHELEINIVVDPARILDDHYLKRIDDNKKTFLKQLVHKEVRTFGIMNIYNYDKTKIPELLRNYDFMHHKVQHLFQTTIDYNFSAGRNLDLSDQEFFELSERIKKLFDDSIVSDEKAKFLRFSFGKLTDSLIEKQYNYRSGELYLSPLMYERFVSFKEALKIPLKNYTVQEVEEFEQQVLLSQYLTASQMEDCEDCQFLASCIDRSILKLMNVYNVKKCLIAKQALQKVNSISHLDSMA